jgi:hypothetical protein
LNEPYSLQEPSAKALKPLLLFELWSLPGSHASGELFQPVVDAIDLAILLFVVVPS